MRVLYLMLLSLLLLSPAGVVHAVTPFPPADTGANNRVDSQADFLPVEQAFAFSSESLDEQTTRLEWQIAPGYYLYRERLVFDGLDAASQPLLPEGEAYQDEFFGNVEIYRDRLTIDVQHGTVPGLQVSWQGCADAGLCYPPQSRTLTLAGVGAASSGTPAGADDLSLASGLQQRTLIWSLLLFFGLGLLLAFTPCSLPMLPILAGIVVGSQATPRRGLLLAGSYVLAMALVYALLGLLAALLGANLQALLQQPWLLASFAGLFVLLALPMFGVFELQLPAFVRERLELAGRRQQGGSLAGAALLGLLSGLLVGPCMTAPLAAALLFIAQSGDLLRGALVLFALGLGMGTPLLLLVTVGNRFMPRPGAWMEQVKVAFGFIFLAAALLVVRPLLGESLWLGLWGAWLVMLAGTLLQLGGAVGRYGLACRISACLLGLWGTAMLLGAAGGAADPRQPLAVYAAAADRAQLRPEQPLITAPAELERALQQAQAAGQWVLIDYYADWCVACKVMERTVFAHPEVQSALSDVQRLVVDVTDNDADSRALLQNYQVLGPPTLLWLGSDGRERRQQRITGEVTAEKFLANWHATREQG